LTLAAPIASAIPLKASPETKGVNKSVAVNEDACGGMVGNLFLVHKLED
jgi:hypothetical protein